MQGSHLACPGGAGGESARGMKKLRCNFGWGDGGMGLKGVFSRGAKRKRMGRVIERGVFRRGGPGKKFCMGIFPFKNRGSGEKNPGKFFFFFFSPAKNALFFF